MKKIDRRRFMQVMGSGAVAGALSSNISKALAIPAHHRTGTIKDVEHIVILMQENRPFDHHFGTLRGVRGFNDPRAVEIPLPLKSGGTTPAPVWLQPAGAQWSALGYGFAPEDVGGPEGGVDVIPPFRIDPEKIKPGLKSAGLTYLPGTSHGWSDGHAAWNHGTYDNWIAAKGPIAMSYMTRADIPYHHALADAFTVGDAYFCSIMSSTNPNRCYLWTGSIGNIDNLGAGGTDGVGGGPVTRNGLPNGAYLSWKTYPERLEAAGISWKIYQDIEGAPFAPDFGDGTGNSFAGNYTDNSMLYFAQYANAAPGTPLYDKAATGTHVLNTIPSASATAAQWKAWAESLFDDLRRDVAAGKLPQVSWICAPAGYTEHSDWPINYGAWYISQVLEILVSNPAVFSKTVFIVNYDEADGSFDHVVPPSPPDGPLGGASTVDFHNEIVTTSTPNGPIGLGQRVPLLAISPWSKGGYVTSEVFDHTSVIRFIEKRFGVLESNISPWRRAVCGDLTSAFNFATPNDAPVRLPNTEAYLPSPGELGGTDGDTFVPRPDQVIAGVPAQEKGVRPARALPYELDVIARVDRTAGAVELTFLNTGRATVVFQVRSTNPADPVRFYTVEPRKKLKGTWVVSSGYDLSVYGPNGFYRAFAGGIGAAAAVLELRSGYEADDDGQVKWRIANAGTQAVNIELLDAYTGRKHTQLLRARESIDGERELRAFHGWYDLVVTVAEDRSFVRRLAGHVETGRDSFSDPVLGGLVTLKA